MKKVRKIIKIDEDKCTGCGLCVPSCEEGAIKIIDGKARLVSEIYCDGLGACLGECPEDALSIEERPAEEFDEEEVKLYLSKAETRNIPVVNCPSSVDRSFASPASSEEGRVSSRLSTWPVQLSLVSPQAPFFQGADLLISADCVPFAYPNFHADFLEDKVLLIGCPKLDDAQSYQEKLADIFEYSGVKSVQVLFMEVPCCYGLVMLVKNALEASGKADEIPYTEQRIAIKGNK
ncbi:MAG: 4Fe-4S binding protein [bacterium]